MFGFLKKKTPYAQEAEQAYARMLRAVRAPEFYKVYGVPDTFDGRFDLLMIYIFVNVNRLIG